MVKISSKTSREVLGDFNTKMFKNKVGLNHLENRLLQFIWFIQGEEISIYQHDVDLCVSMSPISILGSENRDILRSI